MPVLVHRYLSAIAVTWAAAVILSGCTTTAQDRGSPSARGRADPGIDRAEAAIRLRKLEVRFSIVVESAADRIVDAADDREIRRRAARWKVETITEVRRVTWMEDPFEAVVELWVFLVQHRLFLTEGDGREMFGEWQPIAVRAAETAEADLVGVVGADRDEEALAQARDGIEEWARAHPFSGPIATGVGRSWASRPAPPPSLDRALLGLIPFQPFASVDRAATQIEQIGIVGERVRVTLEELPQLLRWQTELLAYDLEDRRALRDALESFAVASTAIDRIADEAKALPTRMREEASFLADDLAAQGDEVHAMLGDWRATAQETRDLANAIERAADRIADAGSAWQGTLEAAAEFRPDETAPALPDGEGGFEIEQVTAAATELTTAATEIRGLLTELCATLESGELERGLDHGANAGSRLIDHAVTRVVLGVIVILVALLGYRWAAARVTAAAATRSRDRD